MTKRTSKRRLPPASEMKVRDNVGADEVIVLPKGAIYSAFERALTERYVKPGESDATATEDTSSAET